MKADHIADRLIDERTQRGWTQEELAERSGTSPTTISNLESRQIRRPQYRTVRKLALALNITVEELTEGPGFDLPELKAVRERHGMNRGELALRSGIPTDAIAAFEEGTRRAPINTTQLLAFALDTFTAELIFSQEAFKRFKEEDERENRRIAEQLARMAPEEIRAEVEADPVARKIRDAFAQEAERRSREQPEAG